MSDPRPASRVRVTGPRTETPRRRQRSTRAEIDSHTGVGEVYMSSLLRAQLRLAVLVLGALALLVGGLPLAFVAVPGLVDVHVLGVPLPWVLLGAGFYPVLVLLGWLYLRAAERNEDDFADVVERR